MVTWPPSMKSSSYSGCYSRTSLSSPPAPTPSRLLEIKGPVEAILLPSAISLGPAGRTLWAVAATAFWSLRHQPGSSWEDAVASTAFWSLLPSAWPQLGGSCGDVVGHRLLAPLRVYLERIFTELWLISAARDGSLY